MNKYIDAERLIHDLEERIYAYSEGYADGDNYRKDAIETLLKDVRYQCSLQQEQSEELHFTPLNRLIQKIPSENWNDTVNNYAKKLRDCLIKEGYRKDAEVLQGYISYMNGNNVPMATMDEQEQLQVADASKMEQPKVDLEKEIEKTIRSVFFNLEGIAIIGTSAYASVEDMEYIARHFYELGLNARKEK